MTTFLKKCHLIYFWYHDFCFTVFIIYILIMIVFLIEAQSVAKNWFKQELSLKKVIRRDFFFIRHKISMVMKLKNGLLFCWPVIPSLELFLNLSLTDWRVYNLFCYIAWGASILITSVQFAPANHIRRHISSGEHVMGLTLNKRLFLEKQY